MKPEPIFINPGTYSIAGNPVERHLQRLDGHIGRMQALLGERLQHALAGVGDSLQNAFTGLSTLLHFCSFTRGTVTLERGMETRADQDLVAKLRSLLVPIVDSQCEILGAAMTAQLDVKAVSLLHWYQEALAEVVAIKNFIGQLA
jgi:hypothetical protein